MNRNLIKVIVGGVIFVLWITIMSFIGEIREKKELTHCLDFCRSFQKASEEFKEITGRYAHGFSDISSTGATFKEMIVCRADTSRFKFYDGDRLFWGFYCLEYKPVSNLDNNIFDYKITLENGIENIKCFRALKGG